MDNSVDNAAISFIWQAVLFAALIGQEKSEKTSYVYSMNYAHSLEKRGRPEPYSFDSKVLLAIVHNWHRSRLAAAPAVPRPGARRSLA